MGGKTSKQDSSSGSTSNFTSASRSQPHTTQVSTPSYYSTPQYARTISCIQDCGRPAAHENGFCRPCFESYNRVLQGYSSPAISPLPTTHRTSSTASAPPRTAATASTSSSGDRRQALMAYSMACTQRAGHGSLQGHSERRALSHKATTPSGPTISKKSSSQNYPSMGARPKEQGPKKNVEGIKENLLCPIHLDLVERAKTLPCQHFMCEECLRKWVESQGDLRCPTCNTTHILPYGGVAALPDNFVINNLVAEVKKLDMTAADEKGGQTRDVIEVAPRPSYRAPPQRAMGFTVGVPTSAQGIPPDPAQSILTKMGNKMAVIEGQPIKLTLKLCDTEGAHVRGTQAETVRGSALTPRGEQVDITEITFKSRDGDYWVTFMPDQIGVYQLEVFLNDGLVGGVPMKVIVRPKTNVSSRLDLDIETPTGISAASNDIYVTDASSGGAYHHIDWCGIRVTYPDIIPYTDVELFGIATDANGRVFVTDTGNSCVHIYNSSGYEKKFGTRVLESPSGIAVSQDGTIYVADSGSDTIDIFRPNFSHSESISIRKNRHQSPNMMLALDRSEERVILTRADQNSIMIFDVQRRKMVKSIKTRIQQAPAKPYGIAIDNEDNMYVSVTYDPSKKGIADHRDNEGCSRKGGVIVYNSNGYFLGVVGENELEDPRGLCIVYNPEPRLIVLDHCRDGAELVSFSI